MKSLMWSYILIVSIILCSYTVLDTDLLQDNIFIPVANPHGGIVSSYTTHTLLCCSREVCVCMCYVTIGTVEVNFTGSNYAKMQVQRSTSLLDNVFLFQI